MKYILLFSILLLLAIGFIIVHIAAPYVVLQPPRVNGNITPQQFGLKHELVNIEVAPNLHLKGYWLKTTTDTARGIIIFAHGVGGCKESYLGVAQKLAK